VTFRHERRSINGVRLHCVVAGSGPLLVLLHGFPEFWYSWRHQIPVLAQHYTVVAPDLRGYNESDKPPRVKDYRISHLVEDVAGMIESFGEQRAIVAGHDWGGAIAWALALTRPEMVEKLIALNIPHPRMFVQHLLTNPRQLARSWYVFFFQLPWLPEFALRASNFRAIEETFRSSTATPSLLSPDVTMQYTSAIAKPGALTAALNYYRAAGRYGILSQLNSQTVVSQPTLLIWGEQDIALGKELTHGLERYAPDLTVRYLPDASHWVQQDRPERVNQYILDFLNPD
jgi:epoxide hydrolase 4